MTTEILTAGSAEPSPQPSLHPWVDEILKALVVTVSVLGSLVTGAMAQVSVAGSYRDLAAMLSIPAVLTLLTTALYFRGSRDVLRWCLVVLCTAGLCSYAELIARVARFGG